MRVLAFGVAGVLLVLLADRGFPALPVMPGTALLLAATSAEATPAPAALATGASLPGTGADDSGTANAPARPATAREGGAGSFAASLAHPASAPADLPPADGIERAPTTPAGPSAPDASAGSTDGEQTASVQTLARTWIRTLRAPAGDKPTPMPDLFTRAGAIASPTAQSGVAAAGPAEAAEPAVLSPAPATDAAPVADAAPVTLAGVVALTFDAGADRGYAEDILDILREEQVPASFGITGTWATAHPDLVQRMAAEGHLVMNHTLTHRSFTGLSDNRGGLSPAQRRAELEEADAIIAPLIGQSTQPWYRLPYGDDDARVAADVAPAGYTRKAGWTVDSLGWRGLPAADIVARCLRLAAPNAVYVFHVGRSSQDGPALARIIAGLRERSYGFVTMADLDG